MPGQKKNPTLKRKKNLLWRLLEKNLTPMYVRKKLSPEVWEKIPPPLLLKANGRPLSIKLQWDVLFQETPSATVTDGPDEPKVTETTEVREGAEATTQVSNHIIALLQ